MIRLQVQNWGIPLWRTALLVEAKCTTISSYQSLTCAHGSFGTPYSPPALDPRLPHDDVAPVALHLEKSFKSFVAASTKEETSGWKGISFLQQYFFKSQLKGERLVAMPSAFIPFPRSGPGTKPMSPLARWAPQADRKSEAGEFLKHKIVTS